MKTKFYCLLTMLLLLVCSTAQAAFTPTSGTAYKVKHQDTGLFLNMSNASTNAYLSSTATPVYFTANGDGFTINTRSDNSGTYLGVSIWNVIPSSTEVVWTIAESGTGYTFYQTAWSSGYIASDATTEGSYLYGDKGTGAVWEFVAVTSSTYTVESSLTNGGVKVGGVNYTNGQTISYDGVLDDTKATAIAVTGYIGYVSVDGDKVKVNYYKDMTPVIADTDVIHLGDKANTITATTTATDNTHWYILTQVRDSETAAYDTGLGVTMKRGEEAKTAASFSYLAANENKEYLVRFISAGATDLYYIQFANGRYIGPTLSSAVEPNAYLFYNINGEDTHFGWNATSDGTTYESRVDNNGVGYSLSFWSTGKITSTGGNNDWTLYEVELAAPPSQITYTVEITGASGSITYGGRTYTNGQTITVENVISASDVTPATVTNYTHSVAIESTTIKVTYLYDLTTCTPLTSLDNLAGKKYYITTLERGGWGMKSGDANVYQNEHYFTGSGIAYDPTDAYQQWSIVKTDMGMYLYNLGAKVWLSGISATSAELNSSAFNLEDWGADYLHPEGSEEYIWKMTIDGSVIATARNSGFNWKMLAWSSHDEGNEYAIYEVGDIPTATYNQILSDIDSFENPTNIEYTVSILGGITGGSVKIKNVTYTDGQTLTVDIASPITKSDLTPTAIANYATVDSVYTGKAKGTITVQYYYDLSGKTRLTDLSTVSETTGYIINNLGGEGVLIANPTLSADRVLINNVTDTSNHGVGYAEILNAYDPTSKNQVWQIFTNNEKRYIWNPGQQKFFGWDASAARYVLTDQATPINFTEMKDADTNAVTGFNLNYGTAEHRFACAVTGNAASDGNVAWWYANSSSCQWEIIPTDITSLYAGSAILRDYTVAIKGLEDTDYDITADVGLFVEAEDDYYYNGDSFTTGLFENFEGDEWYATDLSADGYFYLITLNGKTVTVTYSNQAGLDDLQAAYDTAEKYTIGTGAGTYSEDVDGTMAAAKTAAEVYLNATETIPFTEQANVNKATDALTAAVAALTLNMPETGKYYRLKGTVSTHYLTVANESTTPNTTTTTADGSNIFFLTADSKLVSYNNPFYVGGGASAYAALSLTEAGVDGTALTFAASPSYIGAYTIQWGENELYLYDWTSYSTANTLTGDDATHDRCQWSLEAVEELPLTLKNIDTYSYATLYLPVAVKVSDAVKVYTVTMGDAVATLNEVTDGIIPANTGVVLKSEGTSGTATITTTTKSLTSDLTGTIVATPADDVTYPYVFSYQNGVLGFYHFIGEYLLGHRAYYQKASNVNGFVIDWDNVETGISGINTTTNSGKFYDLSGRQIAKPQHGIYIQNGKKIMVK